MAWIRMCSTDTNKFSSVGLTPTSVTILNGGYRLNGSVCEIDITLRADTSLSTSTTIVSGFPTPAGVSAGQFFGSIMSNCQMFRTSVNTNLVTKGSIASDSTIHFVASYTWT